MLTNLLKNQKTAILLKVSFQKDNEKLLNYV